MPAAHRLQKPARAVPHKMLATVARSQLPGTIQVHQGEPFYCRSMGFTQEATDEHIKMLNQLQLECFFICVWDFIECAAQPPVRMLEHENSATKPFHTRTYRASAPLGQHQRTLVRPGGLGVAGKWIGLPAPGRLRAVSAPQAGYNILGAAESIWVQGRFQKAEAEDGWAGGRVSEKAGKER